MPGRPDREPARAGGRQRRSSTFSRDGEFVEEIHQLERARDALAGDLVRLAAGDVLPVEADRAAARLDTAGQHVEASGLAGAVRPHDALTASPSKASARSMLSSTTRSPKRKCRSVASNSAIVRLRTTAALPGAGSGAFSACFLHAARRTAPARPSGRNITSTTNSKPNHSIQRGGQRPDQVARQQEHDRADDRPPERDEPAADQRHHDDVAGVMQAHHVREGRALRHREQAARQARTAPPTIR